MSAPMHCRLHITRLLHTASKGSVVAPAVLRRGYPLRDSQFSPSQPDLRSGYMTRGVSMAAAKEPGHQVPAGSVVSEEAMDPEIVAFQNHQREAARLSHADEARTLLSLCSIGVISTLSVTEGVEGYPSGSVVQFAADDKGRPIFVFSSLSSHTTDIRKDARASLTVMSPTFQGMSDARVTVTGRVTPIPEAEKKEARDIYIAKNPTSFWIDFGDFTFFRMESILTSRLIGGFARAGQITAEQYAAATPDPIAAFSAPVAQHMNEDHADATRAIVKEVAKITVDEAKILTVDRLGFNVQCTRGKDTFKARIPFPREATGRKDIKDLIVELTKSAKAVA